MFALIACSVCMCECTIDKKSECIHSPQFLPYSSHFLFRPLYFASNICRIFRHNNLCEWWGREKSDRKNRHISIIALCVAKRIYNIYSNWLLYRRRKWITRIFPHQYQSNVILMEMFRLICIFLFSDDKLPWLSETTFILASKEIISQAENKKWNGNKYVVAAGY